jgi:hypothetical protein
VFEVLSPNNTDEEMDGKLGFYDRHRVEEYYLIDPYEPAVSGYRRHEGRMIRVMKMNGHISARLGVRFGIKDGELTLYTPDGRAFQTREDRVQEIAEELRRTAAAFEEERERAIGEFRRAEQERERAEREEARAEQERERAEQERERAEQECSAKDRLAAKLRELGVNPEDVLRPAG